MTKETKESFAGAMALFLMGAVLLIAAVSDPGPNTVMAPIGGIFTGVGFVKLLRASA